MRNSVSIALSSTLIVFSSILLGGMLPYAMLAMGFNVWPLDPPAPPSPSAPLPLCPPAPSSPSSPLPSNVYLSFYPTSSLPSRLHPRTLTRA
eukprot:767761-Hanusia_phi.AAC.6